MKSRPILFSGAMVRAILEGRKTQTRRVVKVPLHCRNTGCELTAGELSQSEINSADTLCPYGAPGDELWVRETFKTVPVGQHVVYRADDQITAAQKVDHAFGPWKPSIFMPRWASRISLQIKSVRVERLQDIAHYDCEAEGLVHGARAMWSCPGTETIFKEGRHGYKWLWNSINGPGSWDLNPWVWVIEFTRKEKEPTN